MTRRAEADRFGYKDGDLAELMTELGGHCLETLLEAFESAGHDDAPRFFIAYTVKGLRLPFQGHKDNHSGLMTPTQIAELRDRLGVVEGEEWDPLSGLSAAERTALKGLIARAPFAADVDRRPVAPIIATPKADELLEAVTGGRRMSSRPRPHSAR
jgi:pyruvate dehydrogenase E1 component